jgi:hypothetical protein
MAFGVLAVGAVASAGPPPDHFLCHCHKIIPQLPGDCAVPSGPSDAISRTSAWTRADVGCSGTRPTAAESGASTGAPRQPTKSPSVGDAYATPILAIDPDYRCASAMPLSHVRVTIGEGHSGGGPGEGAHDLGDEHLARRGRVWALFAPSASAGRQASSAKRRDVEVRTRVRARRHTRLSFCTILAPVGGPTNNPERRLRPCEETRSVRAVPSSP